MKKILAYITEQEKDESVYLNSICNTYTTLLSINNYSLDKSKISQELKEMEEKLADFWFSLTDKYNIPYYVNKKMRVDTSENYIYIDI